MAPHSPSFVLWIASMRANQNIRNENEASLKTEVKQQPPVNDKLRQELGIFTLKIFIAAVIISLLIAYIILKRENIYVINNRNPEDKKGVKTLYE